jgi:hypothetical protein
MDTISPLCLYYKRFLQLAEMQQIRWNTIDDVSEALEHKPAGLNNLLMAGLGMGTLFLRIGAVIQMSEKLHDGDSVNDALFMKQVMDNLAEILPSDTNWKNLWISSMKAGSPWEVSISKAKDGNSVLDRFVTFRNKFVHQIIRLESAYAKELQAGLQTLADMASLYPLFENGEIMEVDNRYHWISGDEKIELHPFIQPGQHEGLPYLFQGLYENKTKAKFINTLFGDETQPSINTAIEEKFLPIRKSLRGGSGQAFDQSERIRYYRECFVGRDRELQAIMEWVNSSEDANVLPIYSLAGMGKGALTAAVIEQLMTENIPVLHHFCGSGMQNNLQAVLYHFILQGRKMPGWNGAGIWNVDDNKIKARMDRLPTRYFDAVMFFQSLITDCFMPPRKSAGKPLVIVIDGLDEAAVSNSQLKISDWFYKYDSKDEPEDEWEIPSYVKWIFTYRSLGLDSKGGFQLGGRFKTAVIPIVQPLSGLTIEAVRAALKPFGVSEEFVEAVMVKGAVD